MKTVITAHKKSLVFVIKTQTSQLQVLKTVLFIVRTTQKSIAVPFITQRKKEFTSNEVSARPGKAKAFSFRLLLFLLSPITPQKVHIHLQVKWAPVPRDSVSLHFYNRPQLKGIQSHSTDTTGRSKKELSLTPVLQQASVRRDSVSLHCCNKPPYIGTQSHSSNTTGFSTKGLILTPLLQQAAVTRVSVSPHYYNIPQYQGTQSHPPITTGHTNKTSSLITMLKQ
jgi:hypothetical protein